MEYVLGALVVLAVLAFVALPLMRPTPAGPDVADAGAVRPRAACRHLSRAGGAGAGPAGRQDRRRPTSGSSPRPAGAGGGADRGGGRPSCTEEQVSARSSGRSREAAERSTSEQAARPTRPSAGNRTIWCRAPVGRLTVVMAVGALVSRAPAVRAQETGVIEGTVTNGTAGGAAPADLEVVVHILHEPGQDGRAARPDGRQRAISESDGLATGPDLLYFPIVDYGGVSYYPDRPVVLNSTRRRRHRDHRLRGDADAEALSFDRLNMLIVGVTPTALSIMEMGARRPTARTGRSPPMRRSPAATEPSDSRCRPAR